MKKLDTKSTTLAISENFTINENNQVLKKAYKEANDDLDRLETIQEWEIFDKDIE